MTVLATDPFTRADNPDLGANWTVVTGEAAFQVLSNQAAPSADGSDCAEVWNAVVFPDDQYAQCVVRNLNAVAPGDTGVGLLVRAVAATRVYYRLTINSNPAGSWELGVRSAGSYTPLHDGTDAWASGDTAYLSVQGTLLTVKRNGGTIYSTNDGTLGSGSAGVVYSSTASGETLDDWEAGDFITVAVANPFPIRHSRETSW